MQSPARFAQCRAIVLTSVLVLRRTVRRRVPVLLLLGFLRVATMLRAAMPRGQLVQFTVEQILAHGHGQRFSRPRALAIFVWSAARFT
jgi:hypothetical protein